MYTNDTKKYDPFMDDINTDRKRRRIKFDLILFLAVLIISVFGVIIIYSATRSSLPGGVSDPQHYLKRQSIFLGAGIFLFAGLQFVNYRKIRDFWWISAGAGIMALIAVLMFGYEVNGSMSWIDLGLFPVQPSEFAKIFMIITISAILSKKKTEKVNHLVLLEPDFGTALIFFIIFIGMLFVSGANFLYVLGIMAAAVGGFFGALKIGIIKQYQLDRILVFLKPDVSTEGAGYNLYQSKLAIGSGGLIGKGLFLGKQTNLSYVPEHHTDFIFSVIGEELGFIGAFIVIAVLGLIVWKCFRIASSSNNSFGLLVASGVGFMILSQLVINIGMTTGIMPIIGIPLPFVSSGGSSLVSTYFGIALVSNIYIYKETRRDHEIAYDDFSD